MLLSEHITADVVPAIIPKSQEDLQAKLAVVSKFAREVQVDIVDGVFAKPASWPYTLSGDLSANIPRAIFRDQIIELDLMIEKPEEYLDIWARTGATKILIHVEAITDFSFITNHCRGNDYRLGIAIGNDTPLEVLSAHDLACVDYIQLMGIATIGSQGASFDSRVLERIPRVLEQYPEFPISIDGSVNAQTLSKLYKAGARRFVTGSAILAAEDPRSAYESLRDVVL